MMWRAARGGTANVDAQYRAIMSGQKVVSEAFAKRDGDTGAPMEMPGLDALRTTLWKLLGQSRVNLDNEEAWVGAVAQRPVYQEGAKVARFLLMVAMHNGVAEGETGLITDDGKKRPDLLNASAWHDESLATIEHVAPESRSSGKWDDALYSEDSRLIHQLGNLTLLPQLENTLSADRDWEHKRHLFRIFATNSKSKAEELLEEANKLGLTPSAKVVEVAVGDGRTLELCEALAAYEGAWDQEFVRMRSRRLAELAWKRCSAWLGPHPGRDGGTHDGSDGE